MTHLIANTGIQFITPDPVEMDFSEPVLLDSGRTLRYTFVQKEDFITGDVTLDFALYHEQSMNFIPLKELISEGAVASTSGRVNLDDSGMPMMSPQAPIALFSTFPVGANQLINISTLESFMVMNPDTGEQEPAYKRLIGKWLPFPMFEVATHGTTLGSPVAWCRAKIVDEGAKSDSPTHCYRMVWAFDTKISDQPSKIRPTFYDGDGRSKQYCLCNDVRQLIDFMTADETGCAFSDYIRSIFGMSDDRKNHMPIAYYIYFINHIRLSGNAPNVTLHNCSDNKDTIKVDIVLDVGNSRTCGVLFEEGSFLKREMLELRDMGCPWNTYNSSFDMRLVFRKADFGNDILLDDIFNWPSLVRVGEEAKKIIYNAREDSTMGRNTSSYSSPKRYLWDDSPFDGNWEFLRMIGDPTGVAMTENVYIPVLSDMFDKEGRYYPSGTQKPTDDHLSPVRYSRSSLMTFVLVEILLQALCQVNSHKYRTLHGDNDRRRVLRNIILTCPTAMPVSEQVTLRQSAVDAYDALRRCIGLDSDVAVVPSPQSLNPSSFTTIPRGWSYDEATCCQLVYLYAEIAQRYDGQIAMFIDQKGHLRNEDREKNINAKSLTICSIDIGAGTTDVMICNYRCDAKQHDVIVPTPLFWDSYYLAGDEILRHIVQNQIIEGGNSPETWNIGGYVTHRMLEMSNDEIAALACMSHMIAGATYRSRMNDIAFAVSEEDRQRAIRRLAVDLMHDYFGYNSLKMSAKDQHCRVDFITQIAHPMAQFWLELLRTSHSERVFSFDDLLAEDKCFKHNRPSDHLLDHFYSHFGFRFEEMKWHFNPQSVANDVKAALEPLVKTLSEVVHAYACDILVLAGRPTSLDTVTEMFIKYMPISPHRLVSLNSYRVGSWYPFTYGDGYIFDQKSIVAVGGMVGYLASHGSGGFDSTVKPISLDFSSMVKQMKPTADYMGEFVPSTMQLKTPHLFSPSHNTASVVLNSRNPFYIGCSQFDAVNYQARPIDSLIIGDETCRVPVTVTLTRNYHQNKELLVVDNAQDAEGKNVKVILRPQTLVGNADSEYWLDNGLFDLIIKN